MKKLIFVFIILALLLSACSITGGPGVLPIHKNENGIGYELFYVEGMPCMRFSRTQGASVWAFDGVSCDWSKWKGQ